MARGFDSVIVGGGLVGSAIGYGLARRGKSVAILDGGDTDFRASRGNFGLIWVQGKGDEFPAYAQWTELAANLWPEFSRELQISSGVELGYHRCGGIDFCLDEAEWQARETEMRKVAAHTDGRFEYEMLDRKQLQEMIPELSESVLGGSYSKADGHCNPLYLLRALQQGFQFAGGCYIGRDQVQQISAHGNGFELKASQQTLQCDSLVLCAGLANQALAAQLDMRIPVFPQSGQLLISERLEPFLKYATIQIRQTDEGSLQIGDSQESVGLDDRNSLEVMQSLAKRAVTIFPHLKNVRLTRAWAALRVKTPDGVPIYHRSEKYPQAFVVNCHSGVTLAAAHAGMLADWICGEAPRPLISSFSAERFDV